MSRTAGRSDIKIGLIDGPIWFAHPDLANENIREIRAENLHNCPGTNSSACAHGTFVAGILHAKRGGTAPAICPGCTLLVRSIFPAPRGAEPTASPSELASAIVEMVEAGSRILNLSVAVTGPLLSENGLLAEALDHAAQRGTLCVAAAGNQGSFASSALTRHPWVIPVLPSNAKGEPAGYSNLGGALGRYGLCAPGQGIVSLALRNGDPPLVGSSVAAPFVAGTMALLWSEFPNARSCDIKAAVVQASRRRKTVVPPLLDALAAHETLKRWERIT
jgi:subtilisin family serine protease